MDKNYMMIESGRHPIKAWTKGVQVEEQARQQLRNIASLPFIFKHVAVMPDVHWGMGATVGSVIATKGAIIPAAVGVDIGCGMNAVRLSLKASDLPDSLKDVRSQIERDVPVGFSVHRDDSVIMPSFLRLPAMGEWLTANWEHLTGQTTQRKAAEQVGTLGGGNHFIELCLDENQDVWVMLHSGSRGIGNKIGMHHIAKAKRTMERYHITLPDDDLAYIPEATQDFDDYIESVEWAQKYAMLNREVMMELVLAAVAKALGRPFEVTRDAIDCFPGTVSIAAADVNKVYRRHYSGPLVTLKFKSGSELPVTPNHPLLGKSGWVTAGSVNPGDHLVRAVGADSLTPGVNPDVQGEPTKFSELFDALNSAGVSERVVGSSVNFHGDVGADDREVEVVRPHRELTHSGDAPFFQKLSQLGLLSPDLAERPESGSRLLDALMLADSAGPAHEMSGQQIGQPFIRSEAGHAKTLGITPTSNGDACDSEYLRDAGGADTCGTGEGLDGLPAGVLLDEVVEAVVGHFSGHVFNLSSSSGWYVAGGIISHNCHHNYVSRENHFGENVIVTRKGAVSAREGQLGIIPGSMGAKSFIVCGKGHLESFCSCSHGAGRAMSRTQARKLFTVDDHALATAGVECRKDAEVVDETPAAYKDIDAVMAAQADLVDVVHTLKQVVCVKG